MLAVFGKCPARRDFIARHVPNPLLEQLEPWLQQSMAQSKETLGKAWLDAYLNAPIWRFWCAHTVVGVGLAGAVMPSVDKMGRYFPLMAFWMAPPGGDHALPSQEDDGLYEALEGVLLSALSQEAALDTLIDGLASLKVGPLPAAPAGEEARSGSLWWTFAAPGTLAQRAAWPALPPPHAFAGMLQPSAPATTATDP
ncbi:MAG: type VI secretion system-associated protein TagF [Pseudomonadota bacterium]